MPDEVGSVLVISRSEDAADFKWRIRRFPVRDLWGWLWSPRFSFAGWGWKLGITSPVPSSSPVLLRLWQCPEQSPSPVVRYWLGWPGELRAEGGREEEEIARGRKDPILHPIDHPWLPVSELWRTIVCTAPSSRTLTLFIRLRSGPETDGEMRSLIELNQHNKKSKGSPLRTTLPYPAAETSPQDIATLPPRRIGILRGANKPSADRSEEVGAFFEISRSEDAADFKWSIRRFHLGDLETYGWLWSSRFSFAGWGWMLGIMRKAPSSSDSGPVQLRLWQCREESPSPVVRYWLGVVRGADGGLEGEEIARGRKDALSLPVDHPWLPLSEMRRRMGRSGPGSRTLTFFIKLRSGPETDGEMRSLIELNQRNKKSAQTDLKDGERRCLIKLNQRNKKSTQTDSKVKAKQNAAVAECEKSFRRLRTSNPHNSANGGPGPSAKAEKNTAVAECEQSFHRLRTSNPHCAANVVPGPSGQQPSDECVLCCEEAVDCALYRCGHMCMCYKCAMKVKCRKDSAKCPICRKPIEDVLKIYK